MRHSLRQLLNELRATEFFLTFFQSPVKIKKWTIGDAMVNQYKPLLVSLGFSIVENPWGDKRYYYLIPPGYNN